MRPPRLTKTIDDFCRDVAIRESSNNARAINQFGFLGLYQFGEAALIDLGYVRRKNKTRENFDNKFTATDWVGKDGIWGVLDFLNRPDIQTKAFKEMIVIRKNRLRRLGLDKFVNKRIEGVRITLSGLVGGAHLVGEGGLRDWLIEGRPVRDGNGVHVREYVQKFGGYDV